MGSEMCIRDRVDSLTMEDVETVDRDVLVAMAVYIGKTRLIDNFSFEVK